MQVITQNENSQVEITPLNMYNKFIERIRRNLHVVLAFSPVGDAFRNRLRMFPSLINCCTIDWFKAWPEDALELVANRFLDDVEMSQQVREETVVMCKHFHQSVRALSDRYFESMRRQNYVTPTSYLELIKTFKTMLNKKRMELLTRKNRYLIGLEKLEFSESQINVMQQELVELKPKLIETSEETVELIKIIEEETVEVEAVKAIVETDEATANKSAMAAKEIKKECETKLQVAIPALNLAVAALDTLKQNDITIVKTMNNPAQGVKLVMEAVCIMRGLKPEKKTDANGRQVEDYWPTAKKMLGDMKFLEVLKEYDKDNIPAQIIRKIREKYITNPEFDPAIVKYVSSACEGLCKWVRAIDVYDSVIKPSGSRHWTCPYNRRRKPD